MTSCKPVSFSRRTLHDGVSKCEEGLYTVLRVICVTGSARDGCRSLVTSNKFKCHNCTEDQNNPLTFKNHFFSNKRNIEARSGNHCCNGMSNICYIM